MADVKKSFIAYSDWEDVFNELPNEEAGALIKHIFAYVNGKNPETESILIRAVFANIKTTLKRDLDKWEAQLEQRKQAGKKSAEIRSTKSNGRSTVVDDPKRNPTDNESVIVSDSVLLEKKRKELLFDDFWKLYNKSSDKKKSKDKFMMLSLDKIDVIFETLPRYIAKTPDKKFRKNPLTYINGECWNDDIEADDHSETELWKSIITAPIGSSDRSRQIVQAFKDTPQDQIPYEFREVFNVYSQIL